MYQNIFQIKQNIIMILLTLQYFLHFTQNTKRCEESWRNEMSSVMHLDVNVIRKKYVSVAIVLQRQKGVDRGKPNLSKIKTKGEVEDRQSWRRMPGFWGGGGRIQREVWHWARVKWGKGRENNSPMPPPSTPLRLSSVSTVTSRCQSATHYPQPTISGTWTMQSTISKDKSPLLHFYNTFTIECIIKILQIFLSKHTFIINYDFM